MAASKQALCRLPPPSAPEAAAVRAGSGAVRDRERKGRARGARARTRSGGVYRAQRTRASCTRKGRRATCACSPGAPAQPRSRQTAAARPSAAPRRTVAAPEAGHVRGHGHDAYGPAAPAPAAPAAEAAPLTARRSARRAVDAQTQRGSAPCIARTARRAPYRQQRPLDSDPIANRKRLDSTTAVAQQLQRPAQPRALQREADTTHQSCALEGTMAATFVADVAQHSAAARPGPARERTRCFPARWAGRHGGGFVGRSACC